LSTDPIKLQCPCEIELSEKKPVRYDFGLLGTKIILVCKNCLKKSPYAECIVKRGDDMM